jgi:hypothetical protein
MIYIVEIPHQRKPFCWSAHDEADAVSKMWQTHIKMGDTPDADAKFIAWIRYNAQDLHSQYVFMDAAAAIDGLKEISGHGAVEAIAALREELAANGELPEEQSDEKL